MKDKGFWATHILSEAWKAPPPENHNHEILQATIYGNRSPMTYETSPDPVCLKVAASSQTSAHQTFLSVQVPRQ